jgi:hypothetical protein
VADIGLGLAVVGLRPQTSLAQDGDGAAREAPPPAAAGR